MLLDFCRYQRSNNFEPILARDRFQRLSRVINNELIPRARRRCFAFRSAYRGTRRVISLEKKRKKNSFAFRCVYERTWEKNNYRRVIGMKIDFVSMIERCALTTSENVVERSFKKISIVRSTRVKLFRFILA